MSNINHILVIFRHKNGILVGLVYIVLPFEAESILSTSFKNKLKLTRIDDNHIPIL